jgi:hypothetical protein
MGLFDELARLVGDIYATGFRRVLRKYAHRRHRACKHEDPASSLDL